MTSIKLGSSSPDLNESPIPSKRRKSSIKESSVIDYDSNNTNSSVDEDTVDAVSSTNDLKINEDDDNFDDEIPDFDENIDSQNEEAKRLEVARMQAMSSPELAAYFLSIKKQQASLTMASNDQSNE